MTDGVQTVPANDRRTSGDILSEAVQPIKDKGIEVMSIGIGKSIVLVDLVTLATDDTGVFLAEDFDALDEIVTDVKEGKCPGKISFYSFNSLTLKSAKFKTEGKIVNFIL